MSFSTDEKEYVADNISQNINRVCADFPERMPASVEEYNAAKDYAERLKSVADDVELQSFDVHPSAYFGWTFISAICAILAFATHFFAGSVSTLLAICSLVPFVIQFVCKSRFFDCMYPTKQSQNVCATKKCLGEVKKSVYIVADIDSPFERTLRHKLGRGGLSVAYIGYVVGMLYLLALSIAKWAIVGELGASISSGALLYAGICGFVFVPSYVRLFFDVNHKKTVTAASENMAGCEAAVETLKRFVNMYSDDTQIGVILCGASSCGVRGALAWCDKNIAEIDKQNSVFLVLKNLKDVEHFSVGKMDLYGMQRCDKHLIDDMVNSAKKCNVKCTVKNDLRFGNCFAFNSNKLRAVSLQAVDLKKSRWLHSPIDDADNVNCDCIATAVEVLSQFIEDFANKS